MRKHKGLIPAERIERRIFLLRGEKVMLSTDLARLYEVEPRALIQAVRRNAERFPFDLMFQLSAREFTNLKSQIVTSSWGGLRRATPYAFTEQGVAMLSSVLRSKRAVQVNIEIMRTFVRLRRLLASNAALARRLAQLERKYDAQFRVVFDAIRELMTPPEPKRRPIGSGETQSTTHNRRLQLTIAATKLPHLSRQTSGKGFRYYGCSLTPDGSKEAGRSRSPGN